MVQIFYKLTETETNTKDIYILSQQIVPEPQKSQY